MDDSITAQVALLIDFENLVYGLIQQHSEGYVEVLEPEVLFKLAEDYGQVVLANAYADWRRREVNQFQTDLYRFGIDLIHVFGKQGARFKNAVDVKMAVDAVEILWTLPHVDTFIIVSGDRDFIHVLKTLRRYGKRIVGVSPEQSVSEDFASLCDRFVRYGALANTMMNTNVPTTSTGASGITLRQVRNELAQIAQERRDGIKGAQIKPLLRRRLSASFDESELGFSRLLDLLNAFPDVVSVVINPAGGDITVFPADGAVQKRTHNHVIRDADENDVLSIQTSLRDNKFTPSPKKRRAILSAMYEQFSKDETFQQARAYEHIIDQNPELPLTVSTLARYFTVLWQSKKPTKSFIVLPDQADVRGIEKKMALDQSLRSKQAFITRYEMSIAYKTRKLAQDLGVRFNRSLLCDVLGLEGNAENRAHCDEIFQLLGEPIG